MCFLSLGKQDSLEKVATQRLKANDIREYVYNVAWTLSFEVIKCLFAIVTKAVLNWSYVLVCDKLLCSLTSMTGLC